MVIVDITSWDELQRRLCAFDRLATHERGAWLFRGHASEWWSLSSTLDRMQTFTSSGSRRQAARDLLERFTQQAALARGRRFVGLMDHQVRQVQMIARHHGLPCTVLDLSRNQRIALFFALARPERAEDFGHACLIAINRVYASRHDGLRFFPDRAQPSSEHFLRVQRQEATLVEIGGYGQSLETMVPEALVKYRLSPMILDEAITVLRDSYDLSLSYLMGDLATAAAEAERHYKEQMP
ncbi:FRG domain-containing protein [Mucisphaera calidilacus]|uniref:FRG domain protein n=1 Tax=Mucisphaera calidilacus TaxID=2527982 RepID=A0A518C053_9BACT|nr:FRG domain-containing protein [Mucisphaera calidilacus]QDU72597.1 FRG domain protein [Mucisphaera calidilacus]